MLLTGGAGRMGTWLRREYASRFELLRAIDSRPSASMAPGEELLVGDIADVATMERAMEGIDAVVHAAAIPVEDSFESILHANVIGTWSVYEAAVRCGVGRIVFASTNHAVGFYPRSARIDADTLPRPDSLYGVSKCWGENLARFHFDKHGIQTLVVRIGHISERPTDRRGMAIWISPRDLAQLCLIGLESPNLGYEVVYGISDNAAAWYDNANARRLGYRPLDRAEDHADSALDGEATVTSDPVARHFQGGDFCTSGYAGPWRPA